MTPKMTLDYRHRSDFTLYEPVSRLRSSNLQQALGALSSLCDAARFRCR